VTDFGPAAWPGAAYANGQGYYFVRHAGKGRRFSAFHVIPAPGPNDSGETSKTLCGKVSLHGWERYVVAAPDETAGGWCWYCADALAVGLQCALDDFRSMADSPEWRLPPVLRLVQGGAR
jgi:hypothetical protein